MSLFSRLFGKRVASPAQEEPHEAYGSLATWRERTLDLAENADWHEGLPFPDWQRIQAWVDGFDEPDRDGAWQACDRAWLGMLADALGGGYRVHESAHSLVLSERPANEARAALEFVDASRKRVRRMLEELAGDTAMKEAVLVFADAHGYARYASYYAPDLDETMVSAGMFLHSERPHFLTYGDELWRMEPTIVHELTHAQLAHLPLPLWVNEGMAVNSEQRLTRMGEDAFEVKGLEEKHRGFWTPDTIQEFWSGTAFRRDDEGSRLAYDLGRLLVNGLAADWAGFKRFAAAAHRDDAGRAAAEEQVHVDLGEAVRHFLGRDDGEWGPRPASWRQGAAFEPE